MSEAYEKAGRELEAQCRLLESLQGYDELTKRQQNIVRGSLVVQKMLETGTETGPVTRAFKENMYCHTTIAALENPEAMTLEDMRVIPPDYYEATSGYEYLEDYKKVEAFVESAGFPCVVLLAAEDPTKLDPTIEPPMHVMRHSCVALGRDASGEIIIWEKQNISRPYRLIPLRQVYDEYKLHNKPDPNIEGRPRLMWGTRPLKTGKKSA